MFEPLSAVGRAEASETSEAWATHMEGMYRCTSRGVAVRAAAAA